MNPDKAVEALEALYGSKYNPVQRGYMRAYLAQFSDRERAQIVKLAPEAYSWTYKTPPAPENLKPILETAINEAAIEAQLAAPRVPLLTDGEVVPREEAIVRLAEINARLEGRHNIKQAPAHSKSEIRAYAAQAKVGA